MSLINVVAIEQEARKLRALEIQRIQGLVSARLGAYANLLSTKVLSGLTVAGRKLRPLFSWNPHAHHPS